MDTVQAHLHFFTHFHAVHGGNVMHALAASETKKCMFA
jgi:hypothetical protein